MFAKDQILTQKKCRESTRRDLQHITKSQGTSPHIIREETASLRKLTANFDIGILAADTVILDTAEYTNKIRCLLTPDTYKMLSRNLTSIVKKKTIRWLWKKSLQFYEWKWPAHQ